MLHIESLQNPTESWAILSILWDHFMELILETGHDESAIRVGIPVPCAGVWNIVIPVPNDRVRWHRKRLLHWLSPSHGSELAILRL
jgi:hypothetical protein